MISRYCEEFGCTPTVARWELLNDPAHPAMFATICNLRVFAEAKRQLERAKTEAEVGKLPSQVQAMVPEIMEFEARAIAGGDEEPDDGPR